MLKPKDDYKPETNKTCPENLKGLYNAFEQYAELNDSCRPPQLGGEHRSHVAGSAG